MCERESEKGGDRRLAVYLIHNERQLGFGSGRLFDTENVFWVSAKAFRCGEIAVGISGVIWHTVGNTGEIASLPEPSITTG